MISKIKNTLFAEFKTHNKLAKDATYIIALRGLEIFLGLVTTYFVVRALSKELFGEYHFILSCVGILAIFGLKGLNNSVMQAIARGFPGTYRKAVQIAFFGSYVGSVILGTMACWYYFQDNSELAYGFIVAALLFPFVHGLMQWKSIHMGEEKFGSYFIHNSLAMLIMYPLIIVFVLIIPGTFLVPLTLILIVPSIQNLWLTVLNYRKIPTDAPVEDGNITYGIKTTFYTSFHIVATHIDKLLLFFFLSPVVLATYVVADRIAGLFRNITQDLSVVLAPKFAKHEHYTSKLDRYLKVFVLVYGAVIIIFAFTILPRLIAFLFGANYTDSIPYAQALLCSVTIGNMATLRFRFIRSRIDSISYRNITVITSLVRIITSLALIPWLGIIGAVISVFLYRIFLTLVVNAIIKKKYPIDGGLTCPQ
jgi:O-antigen/teichoic acid export membrane protein